MLRCPSPETLGRLGGDSLGDCGLAAIESHVGACPDCQGVLERLAAELSASGAPIPDRPPVPEHPPTIRGFEIEGEIGRGGMGIVYRAWQPQLARRVAIKVVHAGVGAGADERRRWLREARAVGRVRDRNVVPVHQAGEQEGCLYLVLDLIPGGNLASRITGPLPAKVAAGLAMVAARAVEQVHRAGILHLDIKPSNILLDGPADGPWDRVTPMITDFGIARAGDDPGTTASGSVGVRGTPCYMAPEQIAGDPAAIGPRTDVFALGATLYHLLTGRPPFQAASAIETLDLVRTREPAAPRILVPGLPRDLETITLACLQKDPRRRYTSAGALAEDLHRWLDGKPIAARPVSPMERTWRWCRRRPTVAILAVALLLALEGGFLGMSVLWRRAERERSQAQAAQARAESGTRTAIGLVGQLIELYAGGWNANPKVLSLEDAASLLRSTRRHLIELAPHQPDRERFFHQLTSLDGRLHSVLSDLHRYDELRTLLEESVREAEAAVGRHPRTISAWGCLQGHHYSLAWIADRQGRSNDCEAHYRRAIACAVEWSHLDRSEGRLGTIANARRALAWYLASRGRPAEARELLLANHRWLMCCGPEMAMDEWIVADRAFIDMEFRHLGLGAPPPPAAEAGGRPDSGAVLASAASDDLPATAWANLAAASLHFGDPCRPATFREAKVAEAFTHELTVIAADQRHRGQCDQARQTVDRLLALARLVVERNPKDATAYFVLANAFEQAQKNAWRPTEDRPAIEWNLRRAVEAAHNAADLAPYDEAIRNQLERLQGKLYKFLHP
jgi:hypothetical protein